MERPRRLAVEGDCCHPQAMPAEAVLTSRTALRRYLPLVAALLVGGAVYAFGQWHTPDYTFGLLGRQYFEATRLKAWILTGVVGLAAGQLLLALWIYGRLPRVRPAPRWVGRAHRGEGYLLFAATVPVAVHCLLAYGFVGVTPRTLVHSVAGCAFYGAFAAKVMVVRDRAQPAWVLPVLGSILLTVIAVLWYSAALWAFNGYQVPFLR